jgi:EmrB/QacA subfamily drug resistance transporter
MRLASAPGRWTVTAAILSSGTVFVESTVVTVALPSVGRDLGLGLEGLQWVMNSYLLTLSALMLLGGSLGDLFGHRRVLMAGLTGFTAASIGAALAPSAAILLVVRLLQGAAGAVLVPNTLALINATIDENDRGPAIGRWSAWSAVSTALGPLVGGWLVDAFSWRWVFAVPVPFGLLALWIAARRVPTAPASARAAAVRGAPRHVDLAGATLVTLGLASLTWALITEPQRGWGDSLILAASVGGLALLGGFVLQERRSPDPMLPLALFRSRQFTGANLVTLLVYAALGGLFFLLMLQLQNVLGYRALRAGASLLPVNALMLAISPTAGRLGQRLGPRGPIGVGALVAGLGMLLLSRVQTGASYVGTVLPALIVFGLGLSVLVAPLTAAVLGAAEEGKGGIASGVNNAAARLAGLLATAALPLAAGMGGLRDPAGAAYGAGYARAMEIAGGLCFAGAVVAFLTIRRGAPLLAHRQPSLQHGCVEVPARS